MMLFKKRIINAMISLRWLVCVFVVSKYLKTGFLTSRPNYIGFATGFCVRVVKNLSPRRSDRAMIVRIGDQYQHRIRFLICIVSEVLPSSQDRPMFADQLQMLYVNGLN